MNKPDSIPKGVLDIFLSDLSTDVVKMQTILQSNKPIKEAWEDLLAILHHIGGCAKLVRCQSVLKIVDILSALIKQGDEGLRKLIEKGVELLFSFVTSKGETIIWKEEIENWNKSCIPTKPPQLRDENVKGMLELFANELEAQTAELNRGVLKLEHKRDDTLALQALMRAAHSIKGAARVVGLTPLVKMAHSIEECFVNALHNHRSIEDKTIELLFDCLDFLAQLSRSVPEEIPNEVINKISKVESFCAALDSLEGLVVEQQEQIEDTLRVPTAAQEVIGSTFPTHLSLSASHHRALRINAETLNRLMGLAGEALIESLWLPPFSASLLKIKREYNAIATAIDPLRVSMQDTGCPTGVDQQMAALLHKMSLSQHLLADRISEFEMFVRRYSNIAERLYQEVIESRMRPFSDVLGGFPRMVRDLAKQLNKKVRLEIQGETTSVDREILEKLESPLSHLLRNAVDHGIELPATRLKQGKREEGLIAITAQHRAGMLAIEIRDDGAGIDPELIRRTIVAKHLATAEMVASLTLTELYDFMFLPGFTTTVAVTDISGRGVGLSAVQSFIQDIGGRIRIESRPGQGLKVHMLLPLTLSVVRALLIQIDSEPYALPLAKIDRVLYLNKASILYSEHRPYFQFNKENIGLVSAPDILGLNSSVPVGDDLPVVVVSDQISRYGLVVDKFIGEKELVVHELDPLLGKVSNISAGAFMEDGSPILIFDVEDLLRSIDMMLSGGRLKAIQGSGSSQQVYPKKRVLVVDDSITVREVECRLLENQGYEVETAVNGMDGWNAVRTGHYDLVVTDIDMPRMNGIEFVKLIRADPRLKELPVMIVSYKERDEDRLRGLDAGANYYLTKSSFHDETLVKAVWDLIGDPIVDTNLKDNHADRHR